ncbi:hypothetical protein O3M35_013020 [Rhynocoris fuscipes]|uniref:Methionine aminopeptidase n=1 Tax=Rhynocoris fuscipes TaxID=488301 RepID=A0AAW1CF77_9HEMI
MKIKELVSYRTWRKLFYMRKKIGAYEVVTPWKRSPALTVPSHIIKPNYAVSGIPLDSPDVAEKLSTEELEAMRRTCLLATDILKSLKNFIQVGVTTESIDSEVHKLCIENNAYPSPLNYHGYPKSCCTSVNNVACHGIPDTRPLADGDIINVDVTVFREGVHGDCSTMFLVGNVDDHGKKLCSVAKESLDKAVSICKPGVPFSTIGEVIEDYVRSHNFTVIPAFLGHGIGTYFHGVPDIYHFRYEGDNGDKMEEGMCFTIEPVVGDGSKEVDILDDQWTSVTVDDSRTAQYEYTLLITKDGVEILTPHHVP